MEHLKDKDRRVKSGFFCSLTTFLFFIDIALLHIIFHSLIVKKILIQVIHTPKVRQFHIVLSLTAKQSKSKVKGKDRVSIPWLLATSEQKRVSKQASQDGERRRRRDSG